MPENLASGAAKRERRLHRLARDPLQAQHRVPNHRYHRPHHDRHHRGHVADLEEHHHRNQVDEGRKGLEHVAPQLHRPCQAPIPSRGDADGNADRDADDDRNRHQIRGQHRLLPEAGKKDERQQPGDQGGEAPPAESPPDEGQDAGHEGPGQPEIDKLHGSKDVDDEPRPQRLRFVVDAVGESPDELVPGRRGRDAPCVGVARKHRFGPREAKAGNQQGCRGKAMCVAQQALPFARPQPGLFGRVGVAQPVERDGDDDDGGPAFQGLAQTQVLQGEQQIVAEPLHPDERCDDDHAEGLHDDLIESYHQGGSGDRKLDLPQ